MQTPPIILQPESDLDGFRVLSATRVDDLFAVVYQLEHTGSGARILHVACDDAENAFSISFPTPPPDDTGMPHILEHSVLAGSRKYPVREPFFEMVKMSMATFINAMTGYDCTYYPVSSNVRRDLFNLADVYFDAVFHPLLSETTFRREAHHLAPADAENPVGHLRIDGIVYSEMKGAFSDPESRLHSAAIRDLLPDTCYGRESGGDPAAIPSLEYEQLKQFHARHYHPGNAVFCFYGNIPTTDYLDFLRPRLATFEPASAVSLGERQSRWTAPRRLSDAYPVARDEGLSEKTYLALNWLVGDATDPRELAALHILGLVLLGNEAAPLRKALVDAKLGGDLVMSGPGSAGPEATFHVGIKGSEADRLDAFREVVLDTLRNVAEAPLDPEAVAAAFQQSAYHYLEINTLFPLFTVMRVVDAWLQGGDPLAFLRMRAQLEALKMEWASDAGLFGRLIRERLLDNPHRLEIVLAPDALWQERFDAAEIALVKRLTGDIDAAGRLRIAAEAEELDALNGRANSPEELDSLPQLAVSDLPAEPRNIPTTVETLECGAPLLVNDVFANGVTYLQINFDLSDLPSGLWADLPRYTEALNKMGAAGQDFSRIARRISANTGGISVGCAFDTHSDDPARCLPSLRVALKTLDDRIEPALMLLRDLLFGVDPRDRERMRDVLLQGRAGYRTQLVQNGQATVRLHAARGLSPMGHLSECVRGLPQLALSEQRVRDFDACCVPLAERIETIRDFMLNRQRLNASVTGSPVAVEATRRALSRWADEMDNAPIGPTDFDFTPFSELPREGLAAPIQVSHSAMVMPAPHFSHHDEPFLAVGAHLVMLDYVMSEIRFKGNAYGAGFSHDALGGVLTLSSFRDPHIARTIEVFRGVADFVRGAPWSQSDIDRAIIGVAKHDERPIRPGEATGQALQRHLIGLTPEKRSARRRRLLSATPDKVRSALLAVLEPGLDQAALCVMASREQLEAANVKLGADALSITNVLDN